MDECLVDDEASAEWDWLHLPCYRVRGHPALSLRDASPPFVLPRRARVIKG